MIFPYKITARVWAEIEQALDHSAQEFGDAARDRYEALVFAAISDVAENPNRVGSRTRPQFGRNARAWHLRLSRARARTPTGTVKNPRHFVIYYMKDGVVFIIRLLHDASDAARNFKK